MSAPGFREFVSDPQAPSADHVWHDTCGEYAIDFAEAKHNGTKATPQELLVLTHDMVAHHEHSHGTTPKGLVDELGRRHVPCTLVEGKTADEYHQVLLAAKDAGKGVVVFLTLAENLVDAETGIGYSWRTPWKQDTKNHPLNGHYIFMDHAIPAGYVCADGANPQAVTRYAVYPWATLAKSQVAALIVVDVPTPVPAPQPQPSPVPASKPEVPAELTSLIADLGNLLNPFVALARDLEALKRKLGLS